MRFPQWEARGFVPAVDVLSPQEATGSRRLFDALEARVGRAEAEVRLQGRYFDEEFVWRLTTHPRVLDAVEAVMKQVALNSLGEAWPAVLVRGEDRYRHFPLCEVAWAS
jgi:hypothetical protein